MSGDGLVRPVNAPDSLTPGIGVQPGTSGIVLARLVIVSGAGGAVYVYRGTPGHGTLLLSITGAAGTDPFGNTVPSPGLNIYPGTPAILGGNIELVVDPSSGQASLILQSGTAVTPTNLGATPEISSQVLFPGTASERQSIQMSSGTEAGHRVATFSLTSQSNDLTVNPTAQLVADFLNMLSVSAGQFGFQLVNALLNTNPPNFQATVSNAGAANEIVAFAFDSGRESSNDDAYGLFTSEAANASSAARIQLGIGSSPNLVNIVKTGTTVGNPLTSTAGSPSTATLVTTDTWHNASGSMVNGWVISGSGTNGLRYRLRTDNQVEIEFDIKNPVAVGGTSTVFTLPSGYFNAGFPRNGDSNWANAATPVPWPFVDTSGNINIVNYSVANVEIWGRVVIPLN